MYTAQEIEKLGLFEIYNDGSNLPIVCYKLKENADVRWDLYDLSERLLMKGWQVQAYPLPDNLKDTIIQRIVCRADLGYNMGEMFVNDFKQSIYDLGVKRHKTSVFGFTH